MRAARAAGQWERIERTKRARPYLLYLLGPSERHRPSHESKAGWVVSVDDPFWSEWAPPNGWGCKCHVRQITAAEAERRGVTERPEIRRRDAFNPATGEIRSLPVGLDPAWAGNPGRTRQKGAEAWLAGKLAALPAEAAVVAARDVAGSWRARRIHAGEAAGAVPVAVLPEAAAARLGSRTRAVLYSNATAAKMRAHALRGRRIDIDALAGLHDAMNGRDVFTEPGDPPRLVAFGEMAGALWRYVVKRTRSGEETFVLSWNRSTEAQRARWREGKRGE